METPLNDGAFSSASSLSSLPFIHSFTRHSFTQQLLGTLSWALEQSSGHVVRTRQKHSSQQGGGRGHISTASPITNFVKTDSKGDERNQEGVGATGRGLGGPS